MPSQLICRPEGNLPVAVLTVAGTLDRITGDAFGAAVRRSLSVMPDRLLLDVARLRVAEPGALEPLAAAIRAATEFPDIPIVICGANADTRAALATDPALALVDVAGSRSDALEILDGEGARVRVRLRPLPEACRQVRRLVGDACSAWAHGAEVTSNATLVATELVANVVRHAHTTMQVTLGRRAGRITLAVRDGSRRMPRALEPTVADAGGRGLHLVRDLTDAWGVLPVTGGKVVWSRLVA
ncbi:MULTISPECIES: ATP-binding protein [Actinoplanes]|uniref:ATP-binding protein n=1 Tax=Actinoplanes TaxID=1865 RepID=UPI0005F2E340|nr:MULTISPECIES: ATP-binding protein [Actinoplanes]GLY00092.1 hypothetical protein Acsp01_04710 [Actinoplanes sp. NBRC 101535]